MRIKAVFLQTTVLLIWTSIYARSEVVQMKIVDDISSYGYSNFGPDSSNKLEAKVKPANFSGPMHLRTLADKCFSLKLNEYRYKLCPFNNVTQHEQTFRWNPYSGILGIWKEWRIVNNTFHSMIMTNGDSCGNTERQTEVVLSCGTTNNLTSVFEPKTCHYRMMFESPLICHEDSLLVYPRMNDTLRHEWDELERQLFEKEVTPKGYNLYLQKIFWRAGFIQEPPGLNNEEVFKPYESLDVCNADYQKLLEEVKKLREEIKTGQFY